MSESADLRNVFAGFVGAVLVMLAGHGLMVLGGDTVGTVGVAIGFGATTRSSTTRRSTTWPMRSTS